MKGRKDKWMEDMNDVLIREKKYGRMGEWKDGKNLNLMMEEWVAEGGEDSLKLKVQSVKKAYMTMYKIDHKFISYNSYEVRFLTFTNYHETKSHNSQR